MAAYRLYYCTAQGKIFSADDFEASNDQDAIERATRMGSARATVFEVWQRNRLVHRHPSGTPINGMKPPRLGRVPGS